METFIYWSKNSIETLHYLLASGADANARMKDDGVTPLMWAEGVNDFEAVQMLVKAGADVNAKTDIGSTALKCAKGKLAADPSDTQERAIVQFLKQAGAKE